MANCCYVAYVCVGNPKRLTELKEVLDFLHQQGNDDLVYVVEHIRFRLDNETNKIIDERFSESSLPLLRGKIEYIGDVKSDNTLTISMTTAWNELSEFRYFLEMVYNIKIYYLEEEFSTDSFYTNDIFGYYFYDKFAIFFEGGEKTDYYFYRNVNELMFGLEELTGNIFNKSEDLDGVKEFIEEYNNDEVNQDMYYSITLHELTFVDD